MNQTSNHDRHRQQIDRLGGAASRDSAQFDNVEGIASAVVETLTTRQIEVMYLICAGRSNQEIAQLLRIELPTVKCHVTGIFEKLGVQRRTQAVAVAIHLGIVVPAWITPYRTRRFHTGHGTDADGQSSFQLRDPASPCQSRVIEPAYDVTADELQPRKPDRPFCGALRIISGDRSRQP